MDFGIFLSYQRIYRPEDYRTSLFEEKRIEAAAAERLGYDMVWVPEHHLIHFIQTPNALMLAQHVGRDLSIRVGTMATLLTLRHPLIIAGEIALTDEILDGRLELGVGRGAYQYEFERLGIPFAEGKDRFAEALGFLERLWASEDGAASLDGRFNKFTAAAVWPRPRQRPAPPTWVAGMTAPTVDWAARKGYHVANWPFIRPMDAVRQIAETFHEGREAAGGRRGSQQLAILRAAFPTTSSDLDARVEQVLLNHRINQRLHFFTQNADPSGYVTPEPLEEEPSREDILQNLLLGTPEECLDKVEEYYRLGVDQLMLYFDFGPAHEEVLGAMEVFAREVMDPFRASHNLERKRPVAAQPASAST
jgi:alkanesulfonate monooxygenase SsuD/methylene tetrahydromethanopterin reductase-like flavin-dependent oxidoreductase (luciferase family)